MIILTLLLYLFFKFSPCTTKINQQKGGVKFSPFVIEISLN